MFSGSEGGIFESAGAACIYACSHSVCTCTSTPQPLPPPPYHPPAAAAAAAAHRTLFNMRWMLGLATLGGKEDLFGADPALDITKRLEGAGREQGAGSRKDCRMWDGVIRMGRRQSRVRITCFRLCVCADLWCGTGE